MDLYPVHLRLAEQPALVVGGGAIAAVKAGELAKVGARVRVVAPALGQAMRALVASGALVWLEREFRDEDLDGCRLVIAATDDPLLHQRIFDVAEERGVLVCCVDQPERSRWIAPAVLRRGALVVTVSTSGAAPALAARLRDRLGDLLGEGYGTFVEQLRALRGTLRSRYPDAEARRHAWRRLLDGALPAVLAPGVAPVLDPRAIDGSADGSGDVEPP